VTVGDQVLPVYVVSMGNADQQACAVGYFGGVHGLERIGTAVVLAHLRSVLARMRWDEVLHRQLESVRLVFMPIVNPGGMWLGTRANPQGVDLMRNGPTQASEHVPFLVGGQRISASLPWYQGAAGEPMQAESRALCEVVEQELLTRRFSMAVDCHSGFGLKDRIWFPYAHTSEPIGHLAELQAFKSIFDAAHGSHAYCFEPQSRQYLTHGDLWDHLYRRACERDDRILLPLTLEMGSWTWVRKNPRQLFSREGLFNPRIAHREQRVLRRHAVWLDFVARAACSHARWLPAGPARDALREQALVHWFGATEPS
jgi:Zinc carboxypeptidase